MANRNEQIKELTDRMEEGVREVFEITGFWRTIGGLKY